MSKMERFVAGCRIKMKNLLHESESSRVLKLNQINPQKKSFLFFRVI